VSARRDVNKAGINGAKSFPRKPATSVKVLFTASP
jgi:hypothetical protein